MVLESVEALWAEEKLIGRTALVEQFSALLSGAREIPAILLLGEEGMGKYFLARLFALALLLDLDVENPDSKQLESELNRQIRQRFEQGSLSDYRRLEAAEGEKILPVADLRKRLAELDQRRPEMARRQVIFVDIEAVNESGQNSLLKTIEESASDTVFILVASRAESVLVTLRSRATCLQLGPLSEAEIDALLEENQLSPAGSSEAFYALCQGNPGRALVYAKTPELFAEREAIEALLRKYLQSPRGLALAILYQEIQASWRERSDFFLDSVREILHRWARQDAASGLKRASRINAAFSIIEATEAALKAHANPEIQWTAFCLELHEVLLG
ncbi:MAG: hypothetical protein Q4P72_01850 [Eubacteriales bacterium]|nr:hypothetical protein [Eubacteriales bacterium]